MLPETPGEKKQGRWAAGWKAKNNVQYLHFETDSAGLHKFIAWNIMWIITGVALGKQAAFKLSRGSWSTRNTLSAAVHHLFAGNQLQSTFPALILL